MLSIKHRSYVNSIRLLSVLILFFVGANYAYSAPCSTSGGTLTYTFNTTFGQAQNDVGYTTGPILQTAPGSFKIGGACDPSEAVFYSAYPGERLINPVNESDNIWFDIQDNDYLRVSSKVAVFNAQTTTSSLYSVPFGPISNNCSASLNCGGNATTGSSVSIDLKIKKRFVGNSYIQNLVLFTLHGDNAPVVSRGPILAEGVLNATLSVPQTCILNTGDIISIDLGPISSGSFGTAGEKTANFTPVIRTVSVKCDNVDTSAALTLRLEANNISGSFLTTSDPNVGFAVADINNNVLIPNVFSSRIPFSLMNSIGSVNIQVYPVSLTGIQPQPGSVSSEGFLRVDFP